MIFAGACASNSFALQMLVAVFIAHTKKLLGDSSDKL
jgi:hypothetical protein